MFETGQIVVQSLNGIQGIVLELLTRHGLFAVPSDKVIIYCTFAPYNSSLVGQTVELSASGLKVIFFNLGNKDEKSV